MSDLVKNKEWQNDPFGYINGRPATIAPLEQMEQKKDKIKRIVDLGEPELRTQLKRVKYESPGPSPDSDEFHTPASSPGPSPASSSEAEEDDMTDIDHIRQTMQQISEHGFNPRFDMTSKLGPIARLVGVTAAVWYGVGQVMGQEAPTSMVPTSVNDIPATETFNRIIGTSDHVFDARDKFDDILRHAPQVIDHTNAATAEASTSVVNLISRLEDKDLEDVLLPTTATYKRRLLDHVNAAREIEYARLADDGIHPPTVFGIRLPLPENRVYDEARRLERISRQLQRAVGQATVRSHWTSIATTLWGDLTETATGRYIVADTQSADFQPAPDVDSPDNDQVTVTDQASHLVTKGLTETFKSIYGSLEMREIIALTATPILPDYASAGIEIGGGALERTARLLRAGHDPRDIGRTLAGGVVTDAARALIADQYGTAGALFNMGVYRVIKDPEMFLSGQNITEANVGDFTVWLGDMVEARGITVWPTPPESVIQTMLSRLTDKHNANRAEVKYLQDLTLGLRLAGSDQAHLATDLYGDVLRAVDISTASAIFEQQKQVDERLNALEPEITKTRNMLAQWSYMLENQHAGRIGLLTLVSGTLMGLFMFGSVAVAGSVVNDIGHTIRAGGKKGLTFGVWAGYKATVLIAKALFRIVKFTAETQNPWLRLKARQLAGDNPDQAAAAMDDETTQVVANSENALTFLEDAESGFVDPPDPPTEQDPDERRQEQELEQRAVVLADHPLTKMIRKAVKQTGDPAPIGSNDTSWHELLKAKLGRIYDQLIRLKDRRPILGAKAALYDQRSTVSMVRDGDFDNFYLFVGAATTISRTLGRASPERFEQIRFSKILTFATMLKQTDADEIDEIHKFGYLCDLMISAKFDVTLVTN